MVKRKQPAVENIDTAKRVRADKEDRAELEKLTNESGKTLEMLNRAFSIDEKALTSALIKLAKKEDLNGLIELANADDFVDSEWLLQKALSKAKKVNLPQNVIDILSRAIKENEGAEGGTQALGNNSDEYTGYLADIDN